MYMNHSKTNLYDLFNKQKRCDVTFSCGDPTSSTGKSTIMAHKLVLSVTSDVFETMFYGEATKHEEIKGEGKPVTIVDIQMPTFKLFLSFIYTKMVDFETPEIAAEFYYAAHKYNSVDALDFISQYMLKELNPENAVVFYGVASLYENRELKEACVKIFSEHTFDVINSQTFLKADPKIVEAIYKLHELSIISEVQLINALERYIDHNEADNPDIMEQVRSALSHIRFLTLEAPLVAQTTLLNSADVVAVVGCLSSDPALCKMPTFLSSNSQKRAFTDTAMEMVRKLTPVYSEKYCPACKNCNHAYWNCPSYGNNENGIKLKNVFQKYKHVWLLDYTLDDLKAVYEIYKILNYVK